LVKKTVANYDPNEAEVYVNYVTEQMRESLPKIAKDLHTLASVETIWKGNFTMNVNPEFAETADMNFRRRLASTQKLFRARPELLKNPNTATRLFSDETGGDDPDITYL
jgi:hypothetical protein